MNFKRLTHQIACFVLCIGSWAITSCADLNEVLPECHLFLKFKYDYNTLSVDAFHTQVDKVELYVFDKEGNFLFKQSEEGAPLSTGEYMMEVTVPIGEYKFMAWAGAHDSYDLPALTRGVSRLEELKVRLKARYEVLNQPSYISDTELEPLWYGEIIDVNFTNTGYQTETINLIKDTNKLRFAFQGQTPAWKINLDDYVFEIIASNGYLDYDNSLLPDDQVSYRPYYKEQANSSLGVVELNTMRLMADREVRFAATEKATGKKVLDINLKDFLLTLRMDQYTQWSNQEYLDREDQYKVVFFISGVEPSTGSWLALKIQINDWTYYIQNENNP